MPFEDRLLELNKNNNEKHHVKKKRNNRQKVQCRRKPKQKLTPSFNFVVSIFPTSQNKVWLTSVHGGGHDTTKSWTNISKYNILPHIVSYCSFSKWFIYNETPRKESNKQTNKQTTIESFEVGRYRQKWKEHRAIVVLVFCWVPFPLGVLCLVGNSWLALPIFTNHESRIVSTKLPGNVKCVCKFFIWLVFEKINNSKNFNSSVVFYCFFCNIVKHE